MMLWLELAAMDATLSQRSTIISSKLEEVLAFVVEAI
jgi:hypothetical protein